MPSCSPEQLMDFASLFKGRSSAYGVFTPSSEIDEKGKRKGKSFTRTGALTMDTYGAHLGGMQGLGVVPIMESDACHFGAIDVDDYSGEKMKLVSVIYKSGIPVCPFRSKSGGLHLFIFFSRDAAVPAVKLIPILKEIRDLLGLPAKTEIFPKQKETNGGIGNWINLPYFGDSDRTLLDPNGKAVSFAAAMDFCMERRTNLESLTRIMGDLAFSDGPPCLQTLALQGVSANRNNFLFSAARYYKTKLGDPGFEEALVELNASLDDPIDLDELQKTVIKSHRARDYSYKCNDTPLCEICNKNKCKERKYGVGASEVSELNYGALTQFVDPVFRNATSVYKWLIDGKELTFYSEEELMNQKNFQAQCIRFLHRAPPLIKADRWSEILNRALANVIVKVEDSASAMFDSVVFREYLLEFLTKRAMGRSADQILVNRTYLDEKLGAYIFQAKDLVSYLKNTKKMPLGNVAQLADMLRALGGYTTKYKVNSSNTDLSVWCVPEKIVRSMYASSEGVRVDLALDDEKEEDF